MNIAIDISPLKSGHSLQHRVRGTGFYLTHLKDELLKHTDNKYNFFIQGEVIPKETDIVHYPYFEPFFLTLPRLSRFKYVVTVHDLTPLVFPKNFPSGLKGQLKWRLQKASLRRAAAIITDSQSSRKDIVKFTGVNSSRVHVVYLAAGNEFKKLESGNWKLEIKRKYNLPDKFALYVGDVTWNKNLVRLVEAIKKTDIPLVMVGQALTQDDFDKSNPWNNDLAQVQSLIKNDKRFITPGFVETQDLVSLYNTATIFVMPSLYEGFGLPILEAMASGIPVITTKEGSIREVAGDAAYFVDAYSVDSIAGGIKKLMGNEKLQKELSGKGLKQASKFTWKKTATDTISVYRRVLNYEY